MMKHFIVFYTACMLMSAMPFSSVSGEISISENTFRSDRPLIRADRPFRFSAVIEDDGSTPYECRLVVPGEGTRKKRLPTEKTSFGFPKHVWELTCERPGQKEFALELLVEGEVVEKKTISQIVLPARKSEKLQYVPEPKPVETSLLIGAHHCPLWERSSSRLWNNVVKKHQERWPALGLYSQDNPEVADWEVKWALDHGISFFVYCWYRTSQGGAIVTQYEKSCFDEGLFKSKYGSRMKFTLMWENQIKGKAGIADEKDLFENLMPYWIEKFFKRDHYLKIDNKGLRVNKRSN